MHESGTSSLKSGSDLFQIRTNVLAKRFNREWIFRNFSIVFKSGDTYAITGPNGSGKSTLLHVLWGQTPPTSGDLAYHHSGKEIEIEKAFQHVSIAAPYLDVIEEFTLDELLRFHFAMRPIRAGFSVSDLPEIMYLTGAKQKQIGNFSSGMKQRVKLGLAFYTAADVLFLDEPGTNLDDRAFQWYLDQLKSLPIEIIRVIASNNPAEYPENAKIFNLMDFK